MVNDWRGPSKLPFGRVDIRLAEDGSHIFETQTERGNRRRIHLHAHGRLLISFDRDQADAGDFAQFLREEACPQNRSLDRAANCRT